MAQDLRKPSLYDEDFYTWTNEQAQLLRDRKFQDVDLDNVIEEIETLGRSEASALRSSLRLIVMHMLKLTHQPEKATNSWRGTIVRERNNTERLLEENPGLKAKLPDLFVKACDDARREAIAETGILPYNFPEHPEFTLQQVRDETFMPNATLYYTGRSIPLSGPAPAIEGSRVTGPSQEEKDKP